MFAVRTFDPEPRRRPRADQPPPGRPPLDSARRRIDAAGRRRRCPTRAAVGARPVTVVAPLPAARAHVYRRRRLAVAVAATALVVGFVAATQAAAGDSSATFSERAFGVIAVATSAYCGVGLWRICRGGSPTE